MRKANTTILSKGKELIMVEQVEEEYKVRVQDFTRARGLPFSQLVLLLLQLTHKSLLQAVLQKLKAVLLQHVEPVRKGRKYERKKK